MPFTSRSNMKALKKRYPNLYLATGRTIPLLMSRLRNDCSNHAEFRAVSERIFNVLTEEAIGLQDMVTVKR